MLWNDWSLEALYSFARSTFCSVRSCAVRWLHIMWLMQTPTAFPLAKVWVCLPRHLQLFVCVCMYVRRMLRKHLNGFSPTWDAVVMASKPVVVCIAIAVIVVVVINSSQPQLGWQWIITWPLHKSQMKLADVDCCVQKLKWRLSVS